MFKMNYSPEHTRLVTPLQGVVSTWFEEQAAAHAAQKSILTNVQHNCKRLTHSLIANSPLSDLSTSLFLKKLKTHLFHSSFPP